MRRASLTLLILAFVVFAFGIIENHIHWSGLDTVTIASTGSGAWKIRVLTSHADANSKEVASAIILQPPSHFDIGWTGFSRGIEVALIAGLGFILLSASGASLYFARRQNLPGSTK